jgi:apolipoprotein N-acyltransferase
MKSAVLNITILSIFSALLFTIAMPNEFIPYGVPGLALIALAPFFAAIRISKQLRQALLAGVLFAAAGSAGQYFWLLFFEDFSIWTLSGAIAGHVLYFIFFSPILFVLSRNRTLFRPFIMAAAWTLYEYFRSLGFLGFPWNMLAHPLGGILPLVQIVSGAGMWPVSFLAALFCALTAEIPFTGTKDSMISLFRGAATALLVAFLFTLFGLLHLQIEENRITRMKTLKVLLVQINADFWRPGEATRSILKGQRLTREGMRENPDTDLVVWSENSLQVPYEKESSYYRTSPEEDPFIGFLHDISVPLLTGSPVFIDPEMNKAMNSAFIISPDGTKGDVYGKSHLVPFAERVPFWDFMPLQNFLKNQVGLHSAGWTPGDASVLLDLEVKGKSGEGGTIRIGTPICFEDCFPYLIRYQARLGAQIFINLTNDSWSKTVTGETQHFAAARYRALESGRTLVRSTNAGVTSVILPTGEVSASFPLYTDGALSARVPVAAASHTTVYMIFGDWFPILLLASLAFYYLKNREEFEV